MTWSVRAMAGRWQQRAAERVRAHILAWLHAVQVHASMHGSHMVIQRGDSAADLSRFAAEMTADGASSQDTPTTERLLPVFRPTSMLRRDPPISKPDIARVVGMRGV